jgi:hypothetical protein
MTTRQEHLYRKLLRVEALLRARSEEDAELGEEDGEDKAEDEDCPCDSGGCGCGPCKKKRLAASAKRRYG